MSWVEMVAAIVAASTCLDSSGAAVAVAAAVVGALGSSGF